jgi:hypothetical protein
MFFLSGKTADLNRSRYRWRCCILRTVKICGFTGPGNSSATYNGFSGRIDGGGCAVSSFVSREQNENSPFVEGG